VVEHVTKKRYGKFKGINKRGSELARELEGFSSELKNAQFRDSEALSKRKGSYTLSKNNNGGFGLCNYGNINLYSGDVTDELINIGKKLYLEKRFEDVLKISYDRYNGDVTDSAGTILGATEVQSYEMINGEGHENIPSIETIIQKGKLKLIIKEHIRATAKILPNPISEDNDPSGNYGPLTWKNAIENGLFLAPGHNIQQGDEAEFTVYIPTSDSSHTFLIVLSKIVDDHLPAENFINSQWYSYLSDLDVQFNSKCNIWSTTDKTLAIIDLGTGYEGSPVDLNSLKASIEATQGTGTGTVRGDHGRLFDKYLYHSYPEGYPFYSLGQVQTGVTELNDSKLLLYRGHTLKVGDTVTIPFDKIIEGTEKKHEILYSNHIIHSLENIEYDNTPTTLVTFTTALPQGLDISIADDTELRTISTPFSVTLNSNVLGTLPAAFLEPLEEQNIPKNDFTFMKGMTSSELPSTDMELSKYVLAGTKWKDTQCENASTAVFRNCVYIANGVDNLAKYDGGKFYRAGISNPRTLPSQPTAEVKDVTGLRITHANSWFLGDSTSSTPNKPVPIYKGGGLAGVCTTGYCTDGSSNKTGHTKEECDALAGHTWAFWDDSADCDISGGTWIVNDKPDNTLYTFRYRYKDRMNNVVNSDIKENSSLIYWDDLSDQNAFKPGWLKIEGAADVDKYAYTQMTFPACPNQNEYNIVSLTSGTAQTYEFGLSSFLVNEDIDLTNLIVGDVLYFWADQINGNSGSHYKDGIDEMFGIEGYIYAEVSKVEKVSTNWYIEFNKDSVKDYNGVPWKYSTILPDSLDSITVLEDALLSTAQVEIYRTTRRDVLRDGIDTTEYFELNCIIPLANTSTVNEEGVNHQTTYVDIMTSTALGGLGDFDRYTSLGFIPAPPPICKYITPIQDVLAYSGFEQDPNATHMSAGQKDSPEMFPAGGETRLVTEGKFGDVITGLATLGSILYIFQKKAVWAVSGAVSSWTLSKDLISSSGAIGGEAHQAILEVMEAVFFLTNKGIYFIGKSDTQSQRDVSANVPEELTVAISPEFLSLDSSYNLKKSLAFYWANEDIYIIQIPKEEDGLTISNKTFIYDTYRLAWIEWEGLDITGGITVHNNDLYFRSRNKDGNFYLHRLASEKSPQAYNDHIEPIKFSYETHWEAMGEASLFKKFIKLKTYAAEVKDDFETDTYSLQLELQKDFVPNTVSVSSIPFDEKIYGGWDGGKWNNFIWGQGIIPYKTTKLFNQKTSALKIILSNENNSENVLLSGYEIEIAVPYKVGIKE
jgi:hypothetical protein